MRSGGKVLCDRGHAQGRCRAGGDQDTLSFLGHVFVSVVLLKASLEGLGCSAGRWGLCQEIWAEQPLSQAARGKVPRRPRHTGDSWPWVPGWAAAECVVCRSSSLVC